MRIDSSYGGVERRRHIHTHLVSRHEDGAQEVIGQIRMRAAMVAVVDHAGRQSLARGLHALDERVVASVAVIAETALRAEAAPQFAAVPGQTPRHGHARAAAVARLEERHLAVERVAVGVLPLLVETRISR